METLFYVICTTLPSHIIAIFQYWNFPWRKRWLGFTLLAINVIMKFIAIYWALETGKNIKIIELLFSIIGFSIYLCTLRVSPAKQLFTYVLIVDYLLIVRGLASFLAIRLWDAHPQSWQGSLICMIIYLITLPPMLLYFRSTAHAVENTVAPMFWRNIWLAPGLTTALMLMFTDVYEPADSASLRFLVAHVALLICVLFVYSMMVHGIGLIRQQALLEERTHQDELLLEYQRAQYARLKRSMDELSQATQVQRKQQQAIQALIESGNIDGLREYMKVNVSTLYADDARPRCSNNAVDALLKFYESQIEQAGIRLDISVEWPDQLQIPEPDVCVVLGNLIENAIEACAGQTRPYISISACSDRDRLTLSVSNTAPIQPNSRANGTFVSSKHEGEGIGTQSVRYIAHKYGGSAQFHWANEMFYAEVAMDKSTYKDNRHTESRQETQHC